ncbi:hypothetical protein ACRE_075650 [Hapsidospora chrysogenum ATCC 11550]|uniref:Zn(2)-C6 fungal-type domain-containing protein n=1 Tax=Hapsidospora chrysogenum (strain ATCC 11550 / CBS 779.69 / DSM 880 / IAM 14645 / JCM 23072 / IMI 49137) TaxID=857340 RepID=A0A086SX93_HAPC1|nr:hypothetical protein ACRE_075650 [Hapsidospora chrysogenum ATCC 11550]
MARTTLDKQKGCGVCAKRKVLCDGARPACERCIRANRRCDGYALRLSWPAQKGSRRAVVVALPHYERAAGRDSAGPRFVNVSSWDVKAHEALASGREVRERRKAIARPNKLPCPRAMRWIPHDLNVSEKGLLLYFESVASAALLTFGEDYTALRNTIICMAFSRPSAAATAVLRSILALSSLHRHGYQPQAVRYRGAALRAMRESTGIVTSSYTLWGGHLCNAHVLLTQHITRCRESDTVVLVGWLHYQYVLGSLTLLHWPDRFSDGGQCWSSGKPRVQPMPAEQYEAIKSYRPVGPAHELLSLFLKVLCTLRDPSHPDFRTAQYHDKIDSLEQQIRDVDPQGPDEELFLSAANGPKVTELYQLALLIYLERCGHNAIGETAKIAALVQRAFRLLDELRTCNWPFLLLILGCEARSDAERLKMLDLVAAAEVQVKERRSLNLDYAKNMVKFFWIQDDLGTRPQSYMAMMDTVFGTVGTFPTLL